MSVWYCVPSKRAPEEGTLGKWREMGYKIMVAREEADGYTIADKTFWVDKYLGWARSVNLLVRMAMEIDPTAQWFVTGGDDYIPDLVYTPEEIAEQCGSHFYDPLLGRAATFGVMQPTGDRWGMGVCCTCGGCGYFATGPWLCQDCVGTGQSALLDRICGSPWIGREFARRMYGGNGPMFEGYYHNFADEELQQVARRLGVLWQRRDLIHYHRHHARVSDIATAPDWIKRINDPKRSDWAESQRLFVDRKAAGFPGHQPIGETNATDPTNAG